MKNHIIPLFPVMLFFLMFCGFSSSAPVNYNVGVVLDFGAWDGRVWLSCINLALSKFYASNPAYTTRLILHRRSSPPDVVLTVAAALDLIKNVEVQAILGPDSSMQAKSPINLGDKAHVPIISFSATNPSLTSMRSSYFFRATQNDSSQVKAISDVIQAFGWRQVVPIYVDNEFGEGIIPYLSDALQEIDVRMPYRSVISPAATDDQLEAELLNLMTMQTRVFVVHMLPSLASRIFEKRKIGMMAEGYAWIVTTGVANYFDSYNRSFVMQNMQGVLGLKTYVPGTKELEDFKVRWKMEFLQKYPTAINVKLDVFGLCAYDAAKALAMAVEKVGSKKNLTFENMNSAGSSKFKDLFGVSQIGPELVQALLSTHFKGMSGDFSLPHGQVPASTLQIVNVIGNGENFVGFWTPQNGLMRSLSSAETVSRSYSLNETLGSIIWPGGRYSAPKGWQIPTRGKLLRILVPVKYGLSEFVNVTHDNSTNTTKVIGGYCLDVFEAVRRALPYDLSYEFITFAIHNGEAAGVYSDLVDQVYFGNYDAAVGDITIRANRSAYVDFTLPYTESGVRMIVPIKDKRVKNSWVFVEPWTLELWVATGAFFLFIGFVVWLLERQVNDELKGAREAVLFSLSTVVFAHREQTVSHCAKLVVIIWCVVVLILSQSYTASLASMLTVQKLEPTVTDINSLLKNGDSVGYQWGSFVYTILKKKGFDPSKLLNYNSTEQLNELFQNGSKHHGISAAFDEIPYIRLFLATYCTTYTMHDPTFKAEGFAFVFPKGSPLARDVSRAILNVNEGGEAKRIEDKWFSKDSSCPDPNKPSSHSLDIESFWGLFGIALLFAVSALLRLPVLHVLRLKTNWLNSNPNDSRWTTVVKKIFLTPERAPRPSPGDDVRIKLENLVLKLLNSRENLDGTSGLARRGGVQRTNSM